MFNFTNDQFVYMSFATIELINLKKNSYTTSIHFKAKINFINIYYKFLQLHLKTKLSP